MKSLADRIKRTMSIAGAFVRMELREELSYPMPFLLKQFSFVVPVIIYFFVSELVSPTSEVGSDYFTFAIIGYAIIRILQSSLTGFGAHLQRAQDRGTFETFLVEPVPWLGLPFFMNLWQLALGLLSGLFVLGLAWVMGAEYTFGGLIPFFAVIILGLGATTSVGVLSASLLVLSKRSTPVLTLYMLAATLLGGMLFPISLLPPWLRVFSWLIPHSYTIAAARNVLMAEPGDQIISTASAVIALVAFNLVLFPGGLWVFGRSMQYARSNGMLSGY